MEAEQDAADEVKRGQSLKDARSGLDSFWREISDYVMPEEALVDQGYNATTTGGRRWDSYDRMFDSTMARANWTLANGQYARVTPTNSPWFSFDPPLGFRDNDRVVKWFAEVTEIARELLQKSNFYSQIYPLYLQRGGFGTSLLYANSTEKTPLYFRSHAVGSYCLDQDSQGTIDTVYREFPMSARQAAELFGEENLSDEVKTHLRSTVPGDQDKECTYLHVIRPRSEKERDSSKADAENMPIASLYIDVKAKKTVKKSGHVQMPYMAARYHGMSNGPYGWGPGFVSLPDARQLNYLEMNLDMMAERLATPPVLAPADLEGDIDLTAGGVTYVNPFAPHNNNLPREWAQSGSYQHGEARAEAKRRAIEDAFHTRLFMLFNTMDDKTERTAREIQEKANERLTQFYPTFALLVSELLNPLLAQVFTVALQYKGFETVPGELIQEAGGRAFIPDPNISFSSTLGLAMKRVDNGSLIATQQILGPMMEMKPEMLDHFNWTRIGRDVARNEGIPSAWLLDLEEVQKIQQARAQAEQEQQALMVGATATDALAKTKGMPTSEIEEKLALVG